MNEVEGKNTMEELLAAQKELLKKFADSCGENNYSKKSKLFRKLFK